MTYVLLAAIVFLLIVVLYLSHALWLISGNVKRAQARLNADHRAYVKAMGDLLARRQDTDQ